MKTTDYYENGIRHLFDELKGVEVLIRAQVTAYKKSHPDNGTQAFNGLFITGDEIDKIINKKQEQPRKSGLHSQLKDLRARCAQKVKNSLEQGIYLPLVHLSALFHLDSLELDILLICLAPELDTGYEKCFAYLQDDVTKKQPTVEFILHLLCRSSQEKVNARACFSLHAPLFKYELLKFEAEMKQKPLLSRGLKVDDRIVDFLLETPAPDCRLGGLCRMIEPCKDWSGVILPEDIKQKLVRMSQEYARGEINGPFNFYFFGPYGAGKKLTAEAFCRELQLPLLLVDMGDLLEKENEFESTLRLLYREALLQQAALYLDRFELLAGEGVETGRYRNIMSRLAAEYSILTFIAGTTPWPTSFNTGLSGRRYIPIEFTVPSYTLRKQIWEHCLVGKDRELESLRQEIDALANKFHLTGGQIHEAVEDARSQAEMRAGNGGCNITRADLYRGCREQSNRSLAKKARKVIPLYFWPDIVLPPDTLRQLKEIVLHVKHRSKVYQQWGFQHKLSTGKGLNVLFYGLSGTGKTMAAEVVARELAIDLYKIDLSRVVSKYIGETEKNLAGIFKEAETCNAILFFDEADALFGKRSEVKDSHDRYANIEIGYLLQKMEEYEGVVILATNMRKNMDEAFIRRMQFIVEFPFPEEESRLRIWQGIFPEDTPLDKSIDYDFLTRRFKLSGGNIKNIALASAFYAADDGGAVTMKHLVQACKREFQKMGKLCLKEDFGDYYDLLNQ
jgi:SpoVK/Ycf46/Vps4 family AAA+-type ATPase